MTTRAQRRTRARKARARQQLQLGLPRAPYAAGVYLGENPNKAKRRVNRLAGPTDATGIDGVSYDSRESDYAPLTVGTPALNALGNPDKRFTPSSYTL